jgi:hypothetical protein
MSTVSYSSTSSSSRKNSSAKPRAAATYRDSIRSYSEARSVVPANVRPMSLTAVHVSG